LQKRGEGVASYPVQAIRLGKTVTVLALSGEGRYSGGRDVVVISPANDVAMPVNAEAAIRQVLGRVGR
jgi:hypothetical protein